MNPIVEKYKSTPKSMKIRKLRKAIQSTKFIKQLFLSRHPRLVRVITFQISRSTNLSENSGSLNEQDGQ